MTTLADLHGARRVGHREQLDSQLRGLEDIPVQRLMSRRFVGTLIGVILLTGCGDSSPWEDDNLSDAIGIWANSVGLNQMNEDVWRSRLDDICASGTDLRELADLYIQEDAHLSVRADDSLPDRADGSAVLAQIRRAPWCNG
ncbi:MAG: hypothetical protein GY926_15235 [bacterium]|nr:hypothetical protein [bacterium]MCP4966568.1 hypothetical protein [bacterium]